MTDPIGTNDLTALTRKLILPRLMDQVMRSVFYGDEEGYRRWRLRTKFDDHINWDEVLFPKVTQWLKEAERRRDEVAWWWDHRPTWCGGYGVVENDY